MRRRRAADRLLGSIILLVLVGAVLSSAWHAIVAAGPVVWAIIVLAAFGFAWLRARRAARRRRLADQQAAARLEAYDRLLQSGARRAYEIAVHQQWVSPHRLRVQANMTEKEARRFLAAACERGLLFQAPDGRYYCQTGTAGPAPSVET